MSHENNIDNSNLSAIGCLYFIGKVFALLIPVSGFFVAIGDLKIMVYGDVITDSSVDIFSFIFNIFYSVATAYFAVCACTLKSCKLLRHSRHLALAFTLLFFTVTVVGFIAEDAFGVYLYDWLCGYSVLTIIFLFYWFMLKVRYRYIYSEKKKGQGKKKGHATF